jgi:phosphoribosylanthranilate isomerase
MTEAKICGLTRPEDAALAVAHGAAYLGVIFAGGPRVPTIDAARSVVAAAGSTPVLGVFGAQNVEEILRVRDLTGISGAQLHGPYGPEGARRLGAEGLRVWRVARLAGPGDLDALARLVDAAEAVLVEPRVSGREGGAGVPLSADLALAARERLGGCRFVLAGGLRPETVGAAVGLLRPDVVDVSSGVESLPGIKDHVKLIQFLEAVVARHADA